MGTSFEIYSQQSPMSMAFSPRCIQMTTSNKHGDHVTFL